MKFSHVGAEERSRGGPSAPRWQPGLLRSLALCAVVGASLAPPAAVAAVDSVLLVNAMPASLTSLGRWTDLLARHQAQVAAAAGCQGRLLCRDEWTGVVAALSAVPAGQLLSEANRLINRVRYISDNADVWSTPTEFLRRGGDCEDFAIAKYLLLREFGVPASNMRIVVTTPPGSPPHAILLVETASGPVALDNLREVPYAFGRDAALAIVYAFNEQSMWLPTGSFRMVQR